MQHSRKQAYWNWVLLSAFVAYQYLLRIYPSIFTDEIRATFQFSANEFSTLSTYCIGVYSCLQIPLGILLDKMGVRWIIIASLGLCLIGQHLFTHTHTQWVAQGGRILIGIGAAPAFIGVVKVISDSFPNRLCGIFIGITCVFGLMTTLVSSHWLRQLEATGLSWQQAIDNLSWIGGILWVILLLSLATSNEDRSADASRESTRFWPSFCSVLLNPKIFLYALLTIGTCAVVNTVSDLWGPAFLSAKYHLSPLQAIHYNQSIFAGLMVGSFLIPTVFSEGKRILQGIRTCYLLLGGIFICLIYGSASIPPFLLQTALFGAGVVACADILCFSLAAQLSTPKTSALIIGWVNTINMLGLSCLQGLVAFSLDKHWSGITNEQGLRIYLARDYEFALGILLNVVMGGTVIAWCMRNKNYNLKK
ncbi:MAG: MFS transporter [Puniceicoccales bacterium]|jgi:MFS family permease|nr:MFS transporter [Puniceicoccales bacterium]